jgi:hypothetical protein
MTINTAIEQVKNLIAPEVKVEQLVSLGNASASWSERMNDLAEAFDLEFLEDTGSACRFKFPGSPIVNLTQLKVIWGATPDEAPYHNLQAFVKIERLEEQTYLVKLYENLMGTRAEQGVYHQVLSRRLEQIIDFLRR